MSRRWHFYTDVDGNEVFLVEYRELDIEDRADVLDIIITHQSGDLRYLDDQLAAGGIRVLRTHVASRSYGILYAYVWEDVASGAGRPPDLAPDAVIVGLRVFVGDGAKVPRREIRIAKERLALWLARAAREGKP